MASLLDNTGFSSRINSGGATYEVGLRFHVTTDTAVDALRWYRTATGTQIAPEILRLWRESTAAELGRVTPVPDDGTVGWQSGNLSAPITLTAGEVYIVSAYFPGNLGQPAITPGASSVGVDPPFALEGNFRCYHATTAGFPATSDAGTYIGVDAVAAAGGGGGTGGGGTTAADLAAWLSTDGATNTHQTDGLPWRTDANVTTVKGEAEGVNGFAAIKAVADAIASAVSGLAGTVAGAVTTITGQITSSTADIFSHAVTGLTAISGDVRSVENHALDVLAGMVTFPGSSPHYAWTAGDPISFDQCVVVAVAAEAYHLEILDHPRHPLNQVCGVNIIYRSGWWCELSGEIGAERHYIDFEKTLLRAGNRRLSGCLVSLEPGFSGVLTPYTLEPV